MTSGPPRPPWAVLPFVRPDLIKLDMRLLQGRTTTEAAREVVVAAREPRRATMDLLVEMTMQLEHEGLDAAEPNVLLACFQEAGQFTPAARSRFEFLATRAAFTGASATACRSARWPGSAGPTWTPATHCAASGTWW
jgi:hypothetical protein